jgi:hypothetical protein
MPDLERWFRDYRETERFEKKLAYLINTYLAHCRSGAAEKAA